MPPTDQPKKPVAAPPEKPEASASVKMLTRQTFHAEFYTRAQSLGQALLESIPELESVAFVPTWFPEQFHLPGGLISWRNPKHQCPGELARLSSQLAAVTQQVATRNLQILTAMHAETLRLEAKIAEQRAEIERQVKEPAATQLSEEEADERKRRLPPIPPPAQ